MEPPEILLSPCPWCGSEEVEMCREDWWDGNTPAVWCTRCGAIGPVMDGCNEDAAAIAAWNKGPYADRFEIHAAALKAHAEALKAKAAEHQKKADELLAKAEKAVGNG
ncbi:MAG TPA: Lar family restriction alleviation protein [Fimbriimonas sp.]|nr:Lar family restriction alleviation protein [Fimbriimonas sp.]